MAVLPIGMSGEAAGFEIQNSLKFNSADSAYLSWTPASAGNRTTWTYSVWLKRSSFGSFQRFLSSSTNNSYLRFNTSDALDWNFWNGTSYTITTSQVFRDPSAWYHIVIAVDTTQATSSNRIKLYVNGSQITTFSSASYPTQNSTSNFNNNTAHYISSYSGSGEFFAGYLTEVNFIDGQALDPTSFGETDSTTGVWKPKEYTGTYGTNGFYLPMTQDQIVEGFNTVLWRGNGGTQKITGVGFSPDLVWLKPRNLADHHRLTDTVRGARKTLKSNTTDAESSSTGNDNLYSFDADGFTIGSGDNGWNGSGYNYVGWCWDAGNSTVSNTDGTITSSVRASQTYGFSVVTFTNPSSGSGSIGHGLGVKPSMIITKARSGTGTWTVTHKSLGTNMQDYYLLLNSTAGSTTSSGIWGGEPTSSVFYSSAALQVPGATMVAYCFAETGYSKFGSYTGNGSTTGPTVTLGWKPAFVMVKRTDSAGGWIVWDDTRNGTEFAGRRLVPNSSDAEVVDTEGVNLTATGFEVVGTSSGFNASGATYIYAAFKDQREAAFWRDFSGNGNHWQPNNLDFNDSVVDVPTQSGTDTGIGAEVRGNYATLNPLDTEFTITNGNLSATQATANFYNGRSTFAVSSGKWYYEATISSLGSSSILAFGARNNTTVIGNGYIGNESGDVGINSDASTFYKNNGTGNTSVSGSPTPTSGQILQCALDMDNGKVWFGVNGTWLESGNPSTATNPMFTGLSGTKSPAISVYNSSALNMNFGQRPFAYAAPSGFKALCTTNLPDPAIADGSTAMNVVTYTGNGSTQSITGVGFQPDWVWIKNRTSANNHRIFDVNRGVQNYLESNTTAAEVTGTTQLSSFDSDGFSVGSASALNFSGDSYVAWNWKAGGSGVSNTDGSITSTVSANPTAGFSIVSYVGTGASGTVGHGLGVTPVFLIFKNRSQALDWRVYTSVIDGSSDYFVLNTTAAKTDSGTLPTSTVFTVGTTGFINGSGDSHVTYCFAPIEGYSAFGKYVGTGSAPGAFSYLGFKPAFLMVKEADGIDGWGMYDDARNTYNPESFLLQAQDSGAESSAAANYIDFLSNGFRVCTGGTQGNFLNESGKTYIYAAFAASPFKYSLAR